MKHKFTTAESRKGGKKGKRCVKKDRAAKATAGKAPSLAAATIPSPSTAAAAASSSSTAAVAANSTPKRPPTIAKLLEQNGLLERRIAELLDRVQELESENLGLRAALLMKHMPMDPPISSNNSNIPKHIIAPAGSFPKPLNQISRQMLSKRAKQAADGILAKYRAQQGSTPVKKFGLIFKRHVAGPSPKKAAHKLTIEQDLFVCLKAGISWRARRTIKSFLLKRDIDIFGPNGALLNKKKQLAAKAQYEWKGEGEERALLCMDVRAVLESRLNALLASGMLQPRHPGQITLVLSGDKGGTQGGTKLAILFADIAHPNSPSNLTLVGYYEGDDNRSNLEKRVDPLFDQIRALSTIHVGGEERLVEWLLCGDYKFLCSFMGHQGASSRHPCLMCRAQRPLPAESAEPRILENITPETIRLGIEPNFTATPLLQIATFSVIPPSFHIMHGAAQTVLDLVEDEAKNAGREKEFGQWLQQVNCRRRKRGQNFTGTEIQRLLTHPNPDRMCDFVQGQQLKDLFIQMMWVLREVQSCAAQRALSDDDFARLDERTKQFFRLWQWMGDRLDKRVTPKVHMLCAHLPTFARIRGWFAAISEQSIEHLHATFNRLEPRFLNTPQGAEGAALQFARHQILANWLHDNGMDPAAAETATTEEEEEEAATTEEEEATTTTEEEAETTRTTTEKAENAPGPIRRLNFGDI